MDPSAGTVTITYCEVEPYQGNGANTYQVVLQDTGDGNLEVEFIYDDIDWHQSGGSSAITGVTDGKGGDYPLDGPGRPNELNKYDKNDFGGDDPEGTFKLAFANGFPNLQDGVVDGSGGDDISSVSILGVDVDGDAVSSGADSVLAGTGNDFVESGDGDDTVHGGTGSDTISGGDGADQIHGDGILGTQATTTTSINAPNFSDTFSGFTVSARVIENGNLSSASTSNVATILGGFGARGVISDSDSRVSQQTGFDLASGQSEELIVEFDEPVSDASFSFSLLYSNTYSEQAPMAHLRQRHFGRASIFHRGQYHRR